MEHAAASDRQGTLAEYLAVLRRRKWIVLLALAIVPLSALLFSLRQERLYEASAEVLLSRENLAASLTGTVDPTLNQQADRVAQTQAELARVPEVVERAIAEADVDGLTVREFLDASSVSTRTNADLLLFKVTHADPETAQRLATEYAEQFTLFRTELDTSAIVKTRAEVQERIDDFEDAGDRRSPLYRSLVERDQQLAEMEALRTSTASVVRRAQEAEQVQPRPVRNAILGILLGLGLGVALAFLWEALDTRVRNAEEIGERLGMPLLGRLPAPPRKLRTKDRLVMLHEPDGVHAEAFRVLRTNLDFVRMDRSARTIMVTSAVEQEGKSTTIANLAVALARAGKRVVLVDLDLRRPYLDRFFDLDDAWGVTQVALGHVSLDAALTPLTIAGPKRRRGRAGDAEEADGNGQGHGALLVLPAGPLPPDPGEFVGTKALEDILGRLREQSDVVLVDAPPLLHVSDALTLSAKVEGVIVVTRLSIVRKRMLDELRAVLGKSPAAKLGFVLTAADAEQGYGYGRGYYYSRAEKRSRRKETVA